MSDRTEAPTPRRLADAREEGQVVRSVELNAAAVMLIGVYLLSGPGRTLAGVLKDQVSFYIMEMPSISLTDAWLKEALYDLLLAILPSLAMIVLGVAVTGIVVTVAQTGFLFTTKKMGFDFKRVNPLTGLKRLFSARSLVELLKALLKLVLVGYVAYSFLQGRYAQIIALSQMDFGAAVSHFIDLMVSLTINVGGAYLILAIADYAYQRWEMMRSLKMTKQEIKEEIKRSEGDPYYKARIRGQQRRMARMRMMQNVPNATVIVTNPTHFAVAIQYDEKMNAPKVVAKGAHLVAQRIVALAKEHNVPIVQNIPLARAMYKSIEIDQEISADLYMAMAEVLAYVYRLRNKNSVPAAARP